MTTICATEYVDTLMVEVLQLCSIPRADGHMEGQQGLDVPPALSEQYDHPNKQDLVQQHLQRFSH